MKARTPLLIQRDVILALLIRELKTRFGTLKLGYLWAVLEPAMHVLVFAVIFHFRGTEIYSGVPTFLFLLAGIAPWLFFSYQDLCLLS